MDSEKLDASLIRLRTIFHIRLAERNSLTPQTKRVEKLVKEFDDDKEVGIQLKKKTVVVEPFRIRVKNSVRKIWKRFTWFFSENHG